MDTGCPGLLTLLLHPPLHRNQACLARTLERNPKLAGRLRTGVKVAGHLRKGAGTPGHLEIGVKLTNHWAQMPVAALVKVTGIIKITGIIGMGKVARSLGATAVTRDLALTALREGPTIETLHQGCEISTHNHNHLDLFCWPHYLLSLCWLSAEGHLNELYITNLPCFLRRCCSCVLRRRFYDIDTKTMLRSVFFVM